MDASALPGAIPCFSKFKSRVPQCHEASWVDCLQLKKTNKIQRGKDLKEVSSEARGLEFDMSNASIIEASLLLMTQLYEYACVWAEC